MSQTETLTREDRRSALDAFASMPMEEAPTDNLPAVVPQGPAREIAVAQDIKIHRDPRRVLERLRVLAAAAGDSYYYRYPVRNRKTGQTDYITGPNIKLANDVAREYGNCRVDCDWIDGGGVWLFKAVFTDWETGFSLARLFRTAARGSRLGGDDVERKLDAAFQIAQSKAERNVVVNALKTFTDFAFEEAQMSAVDKYGKRLEHYRKAVPDALAKRNIDIKRVEAVVGRPAREWLAPDIASVVALMNGIDDGMASAAETFPPLAGEEPQDTTLDTFASGPDAGTSPSEDVPGDDGTAPPETPPSSAEPNATGSVDLRIYAMCVDKIIRAATDKKLPDPADRLANLRGPVKEIWMNQPVEPGFVEYALTLAEAVVEGTLKDGDARRLLEARVP